VDLGRFDQIQDFGFGTGHYLDLTVKHSLSTAEKSYCYDVSVTACEEAASYFPRSIFSDLDLTQRARNEDQGRRNAEQGEACAAFHDSRHAVVRISETGDRHREYR